MDEVRINVSGKYEFTVIKELADILVQECSDKIKIAEG
jgi:hypothetical protein